MLAMACASGWFAMLTGPMGAYLPATWQTAPMPTIASVCAGACSGLLWWLLQAASQRRPTMDNEGVNNPANNLERVSPDAHPALFAWVTAVCGVFDLRVYTEDDILSARCPEALLNIDILDAKTLVQDQKLSLQRPGESLPTSAPSAVCDGWRLLDKQLSASLRQALSGPVAHLFSDEGGHRDPTIGSMPWCARLDLVHGTATDAPPWHGALLVHAWVGGPVQHLCRAMQQYRLGYDGALALPHCIAWMRLHADVLSLVRDPDVADGMAVA